MSLRVFHTVGEWAPHTRLRLGEQESRYLLRVRRAKRGAALDVLDGERSAWHATLVDQDDKTAIVELERPHPPRTVPDLVLLLVVPEPRATTESITHACELGATEIRLIRGEHSPGPVPSRARIDKTIRAAQRQCGRPVPPTVIDPAPLDAALASTATTPGFVASFVEPGAETTPRWTAQTGARVLIGPEGGLSSKEQAVVHSAGLSPMSLGPWVLRTPTAVAASLAILLSAVTLPSQPGTAD